MYYSIECRSKVCLDYILAACREYNLTLDKPKEEFISCLPCYITVDFEYNSINFDNFNRTNGIVTKLGDLEGILKTNYRFPVNKLDFYVEDSKLFVIIDGDDIEIDTSAIDKFRQIITKMPPKVVNCHVPDDIWRPVIAGMYYITDGYNIGDFSDETDSDKGYEYLKFDPFNPRDYSFSTRQNFKLLTLKDFFKYVNLYFIEIGEYIAQFKANKKIVRIGCQTLTYDHIKEIINQYDERK